MGILRGVTALDIMAKIWRGVKRDDVAEAARPLYLVSASITFALNELLKTKSKLGRQIALKRLDEDLKYFKMNLALLRREVERGR